MDRRTFLTAIFGLAGAAAVTAAIRPVDAVAGVPGTHGVLDELNAAPMETAAGNGEATVEPVDYHGRERRHHRRDRRHRRRVWRRVCRRYRHHGRWHTRCHRERAWVWY